MDDFAQKFVNEAEELLEQLEDALLNLEKSPDDENIIYEIFRIMHSLKGSGAMFGFDELSALTHELESLYQKVQSHDIQVSEKLINITFKSIDVIRSLLAENIDADAINAKNKLIKELNDSYSLQETTSENKKENNLPKQKTTKNIKVKEKATWFIHFEPGAGVLKDGTRPMYLLDELLDTGKGIVFLHTDHLPDFLSLEPELTYLYWDIILTTDIDENEIKDVFIFVEDNSVVEITCIAETDLMNNSQFVKKTEKLQSENSDLFKEEIYKLAKTFLNIKEKPESSEKHIEQKKEQKTSSKQVTGKKDIFEEVTTVRVSSEKLDRLMDLLSEMITAQSGLEHFNNKLQNENLQQITEVYEKLVRKLKDNVLDLRLIPIYTLISRFKRLVRDLSGELEKKVRLETHGTDNELDKSIIEQLYNPIMHIIRNSIDHGIETPEERIKQNKPEEGLLSINTYHEASSVVIEIKDDGRGMDVQEIRKKAIEKKLIQPDTELTNKELINLIFHPGFSTSDHITEVSGRGVGMDVVKNTITDLRGEVEVETEKGKGSVVRMILPLTLSIIDGLLVFIGDSRYLISIDYMKHIYEVDNEELNSKLNNWIVRDNKQIPYVNLIDGMAENTVPESKVNMLVLEHDKKEIGFIVSSVAGKLQGIIRPLPGWVQQSQLFTGATIMGDGKVVLVLDVVKIFQKFSK